MGTKLKQKRPSEVHGEHRVGGVSGYTVTVEPRYKLEVG